MPLIAGKSPSSFSKNVSTEMHAGKPLPQSLAIAYAMKRKAEKMAKGGVMCAHGKYQDECSEHHYADGGFVEQEEASGYHSMPMEHEKMNPMADKEDDRMLNQHGEHEVGAEGMYEDDEHHAEHEYSHPLENQDEHEDIVGRIMAQREEHYAKGGRVHGYSEGGRVANDTPIHADFEDNQFDDLVKDDDLDFHYTGANSGDEIGDEAEDEDRHDIVSRIMRSRALKNRGGSGSNVRVA